MADPIRVGLVALDDVVFHGHNVRRALGDLRSLTESIRRFGVMQPVSVEMHGGLLRLRAGHRRVAAARLAGLKRIPAVIHSDTLDDVTWLTAAIHENAQRRELDLVERRRAVDALRGHGCSWDGIAEAFGVTAATVRGWTRDEAAPAAEPAPSPRPTPAPPAAGRDAQPPRPRRVTSVGVTRLQTFVDAWRDTDATAAQVLDALAHVVAGEPVDDHVPTAQQVA